MFQKILIKLFKVQNQAEQLFENWKKEKGTKLLVHNYCNIEGTTHQAGPH